MRVKKCLKPIKLPLLIIALIIFSFITSGCCSTPPIEKVVYPRPSAPVEPALTWFDIEDYFGLTDADFDSLIGYLDEVLGYIEKNNNTYDKYESKKEGE